MPLNILNRKHRFGNSIAYISQLADLDLIEFILRLSVAEDKVKAVATLLINEFGSINGIIHADENKLNLIEGINEQIRSNIAIFKEIFLRSLYTQIEGTDIISSYTELVAYLKFSMGTLTTEQLRILFLNTKNILIADEIISNGTINHIQLYPREIIKKILFHNAKSIILVHNHPSGNVKPSQADIELTKKISKACKTIDVSVHDHIIITKDKYYSFMEKVSNDIENILE